MATEAITVTGMSDDELRIANALLAQLNAKARRNILRASYYDGKRAIRQVGTVIPPHYYRLGIVLGWSAKAVDVLARRCNLEDFVWPDGKLADVGYDELAEENNLTAEASSAMVSSLIHGVSFLVNTKGAEADEPESLIHVKDAMNATGEWNGRRRRLENLISVTARDPRTGKPSAFVLYLDGLTISAEVSDGVWVETDRSAHPWHVPAEALVYKARAGRPMGMSRISRAVMSLHDQALRTVIRMEGHLDVYSYPEMWLLGADESIFRNADGTQKAAWQIMLGRIKAIPDDDDAAQPRADVKQFPASSPAPHLEALRQQAMLFSGETSIPLTSLGVSDMSNPTSADSYIASREDLIAEAEGATDDWAPAFRRAMARALAIKNGKEDASEFAKVEPRFRSPIYLSRAAAADAGAKQIAAAPWLAETEVGLELLGLDRQQVRRAMADRTRVFGRMVVSALNPTPSTITAPAPDPTAVPDAPAV